MPPTYLCGIYDVTYGMPSVPNPHWATCSTFDWSTLLDLYHARFNQDVGSSGTPWTSGILKHQCDCEHYWFYLQAQVWQNSVLRTTLVNPQEPLGKGSKTSQSPSHLSLTMPTQKDTPQVDSFSIVGRESHNFTMNIKKTMFIRVNDPSLKRNIEKYQLLLGWSLIKQSTSQTKDTFTLTHLPYCATYQSGATTLHIVIEPGMV